MSEKFLTDGEIDSSPIQNLTVAVIGYGSQGRSHALNLRDSGVNVVVGQRPGHGFEQAVKDGFSPVSIAAASAQGDLIALLLPDEIHREVFQEMIKPQMSPGNMLLTCHGFSLLYGQIDLPARVCAVLVAPKAAGHRVRSAYTEGGGVPCLVAPGPSADQAALKVALAYAKGLGGGRAGVLMTTIAEETETDLFGEQAVLCGGVSALVKAGFETLVEAGYQHEVAYFECVHELKLVVDLLYQGGLAYMRDHISNTAEYGDYSRGNRVINDAVRMSLREILDEIQSGQFAQEWLQENRAGCTEFQQMRNREQQLLIEQVGQDIVRLGQ